MKVDDIARKIVVSDIDKKNSIDELYLKTLMQQSQTLVKLLEALTNFLETKFPQNLLERDIVEMSYIKLYTAPPKGCKKSCPTLVFAPLQAKNKDGKRVAYPLSWIARVPLVFNSAVPIYFPKDIIISGAKGLRSEKVADKDKIQNYEILQNTIGFIADPDFFLDVVAIQNRITKATK
ncbi:MAG: hypothetical protein WCL34_10195 [Methylococcaceae bacterium]|jgi:hypothetical protein